MLLVCVFRCYVYNLRVSFFVFFFKQKTAYEMRISDWSSDVCSSDLPKLKRLKLSLRLLKRRPKLDLSQRASASLGLNGLLSLIQSPSGRGRSGLPHVTGSRSHPRRHHWRTWRHWRGAPEAFQR